MFRMIRGILYSPRNLTISTLDRPRTPNRGSARQQLLKPLFKLPLLLPTEAITITISLILQCSPSLDELSARVAVYSAQSSALLDEGKNVGSRQIVVFPGFLHSCGEGFDTDSAVCPGVGVIEEVLIGDVEMEFSAMDLGSLVS